jgi:hypothetical protein
MKFLSSQFDRAFIDKELKHHRENMLIERERGLMVATQPYVENLILSEDILTRVRALETARSQLGNTIGRLLRERDTVLGRNMFGSDKRQFVQKCRNGDCKGFLSTQWRCGLCKHYSCSDCLEVLGLIRRRGQGTGAQATAGAGAGAGAEAEAEDEEEDEEERPDETVQQHVCDPNTVATVSLLKRDTKPCPSCQTPIFRIEGCAQMWCTVCNSGFNWTTGRKETGIIHNPHYFEWQQNRAARGDRNDAAVEEGHCCGDDANALTHQFVDLITRHMRSLSFSSSASAMHVYQDITSRNPNLMSDRRFRTICRWIMHINIIDLPRFHTNDAEDNLHIRVQYMRNRLPEEVFKRKLQQMDKQRAKRREYYSIISMATAAATDILRRFGYIMEKISNGELFVVNTMETSFDLEINELIAYSNARLCEISKAFKSVQYHLTDKFQLTRAGDEAP